MTDKENLYARVTQKIVNDLEKGELTWRKPWHGDSFTGYYAMCPMPYPDPHQVNPEQRIEELETFFRQTKAEIITGREPGYSTMVDCIVLPPFEHFDDAPGYYGVLSHELTHWTSHPGRLSRNFNQAAKGDEGYAKEEIVAELGASFLAADLGFEPVTRESHAAYIQMWLDVLQNDLQFLCHAAAHAQRAVEFLKGLQQETASEAATTVPCMPMRPPPRRRP